ncbi:transglutaminase domain-containing protein [uncultured Winogradskyella sp.]|uniref:transglutaminase domain-containing protein n=1 Tax=uncultured Winogradskyella sp. TaxID=395353 RepID=UPI002613E1D9|nr:transglutaminase domain-containing protein [uncultured Winogradskyella sp.]
MKTIIKILLFITANHSFAQISDFNHIDFKKADSIALSYTNEGLYNLPKLAFQLTNDLDTDAEKFRSIYFWVCHNISNNYSLYLRNKHQRHRLKNDSIKLKNWNDNFKKKLFKKLLKHNTTICTGYAYLVRELANLANIKCNIIQGYGRVSTTNIETLDLPNHSWNAVKLNDKWYLCDPTWASGIPNPKTNSFSFQYNNGFFLAEPKLFAVNHFPVDEKWSLIEDNAATFKEFLAAPIIYGKAYERLDNHILPKEMHQTIKRFENVRFEYQLKKQIQPKAVVFKIDNGTSIEKIEPMNISVQNSTLKIEHQFTKKGFYDVHLYLEDHLIATYTFKIKS